MIEVHIFYYSKKCQVYNILRKQQDQHKHQKQLSHKTVIMMTMIQRILMNKKSNSHGLHKLTQYWKNILKVKIP